MYFDKELCLFGAHVSDKNEILQTMAHVLFENKIVNKDFYDGIMKREQEYPTGLLVGQFGFALPHTDSSYVYSSQICFASLATPVAFSSMADADEIVPVQFVFMLAMKEPHEQLENLQNLMELFQNEECVNGLAKCQSKEEFKKILTIAGVQ